MSSLKDLYQTNSLLEMAAIIGIAFTFGWKWFWLALFIDAAVVSLVCRIAMERPSK